MGKPFEKHTRFFALPVATVLSDQKAPVRAAAIQTLTAIATACNGLDSLVQGFTTAMETSNPLQKGSLFHFIADWFKEHEPSSDLDLSGWAAPIVACLDDRNADVRKGAQALLPTLITCAGFDYVMQQTSSLKPASKSSAVPLINAARPAAPAPVQPPPPKSIVKAAPISSKAAPVSPPPMSPSPPLSPAATSVPLKTGPGTKLMGVRRKLPQGSGRPDSRPETPLDTGHSRLPSKGAIGGLKRPGAVPASKVAVQAPAITLPFLGMNMDAKKSRLNKDAQRWINEGGATRKDLAEVLQSQMEPHASKDLVARLFSHDHNAVNDHISGLTTMCELFISAQGSDETTEAVCLANFDLPLKYASIKAHEPQPNLISKCLDLVEAVLGFLRSVNYQLTDTEALCFIPTMIFKVFQFIGTLSPFS